MTAQNPATITKSVIGADPSPSDTEVGESIEWLRKLIGSPIWADIGDEVSPRHLRVVIDAAISAQAKE